MSDKQMAKFSKSNFIQLDIFQKGLRVQLNMENQVFQKMEYEDLSDKNLVKWSFLQLSNINIYLLTTYRGTCDMQCNLECHKSLYAANIEIVGSITRHLRGTTTSQEQQQQ